MVDLSDEMSDLARALGPGGGNSARLVQFVAGEPGEGASTCAREFARVVAEGATRGVWLIELDLMRGEQYTAISEDPETYGFLGAATRASPDGSAFFSVTPEVRGLDGRPWAAARYIAAYPVGGKRFWVTRFRQEALRPGQAVSILGKSTYWASMRRHADWVVVDAPAYARSKACLAVASQMDANVLVVAADRRDVAAPQALKGAIERAGGFCAGMVLNRAAEEAPKALKALLP
jgi:hypothetical protein